MSGEPTKQILFVDDEADFLAVIRELFLALSGGAWEITTATSHAEALAALHRGRMDLVVLDIGMPVMDGLQFLRLLARTNPGQQVVMLTGGTTAEQRATCLENGAALVLEKPASPEGFAEIFAALNALAGAQSQAGFRGMMQRVGLQEVLQMECLGRKSSILEVFTERVRGGIYICDGSIVHAESNALQGEVALYSLLALRGGGFNLMSYTEPARRTISGHWEFLLMEAARLTDEESHNALEREQAAALAAEASTTTIPAEIIPVPKLKPKPEPEPEPPPPPAVESVEPQPSEALAATTDLPESSGGVTIEEVALCSGAGELLYEWQCANLPGRMRLLEQVEQQATQLAALLPVGRFDRLEILTRESRAICQVQPDRRLFVRATRNGSSE